MNDEQNPNEPAIGLYRDPESGQFIGALDANQAAAIERTGFKLFEAGREAAMTPQDELDALMNPAPETAAEPQEEETETAGAKKGKK